MEDSETPLTVSAIAPMPGVAAPEVAAVFLITGMDCAECARTIESGVARLPGITSCRLNFGAARLTVTGETPAEVIVTRVKELGYGVALPGDATPAPPTGWLVALPAEGAGGFLRFLLGRSETMLALLGALLILPGLMFDELLPGLGVSSPVFTFTSLAALAVAGWPIARSAWRSLTISRAITINVLMTIAAVGAVVIGAYTEAGLVMVLFAISEALEGYTMERTRASIRGLMSSVPAEATVLRPCIDCAGHMGKDGYSGGPCPFCGIEEQRIPVVELAVGDTVLVLPGEQIPTDGRVTAGISAVNQAPITGESVPVEKLVGDELFAGTINGEGALEMAVTTLAGDSTLARIIRLVEDAQERKAPAERFVDRFSRWYTPAVVGLALLIAVLPPLLLAQAFWGEQGWLYRALQLLVVACPCALVISTPVTVISAIANSARHGVLFKGGAYLEALPAVRAVAFDKTGTLTTGTPVVVRYRAATCTGMDECEPCDDLLALAGAVERRSEHPLARAIVQAGEMRGLLGRYPVATGVMALPGKGVQGQVGERTVLIGSHRFFDAEFSHDPAVCAEITALSAGGLTPMLVGEVAGDERSFHGYAVLADSVRPTAAAAIAALHQAGVVATVMLTGDSRAVAESVAAQTGVRSVQSELLPEQKAAAIAQLLETYGSVAMVGDGVNDAPALAAATVGVAMGAGTAQALETADVALMGNDLGRLAWAIRLARAAMNTVYVNVGLSIGVKVAFLALVLLGWGTLWLAVLADVGVSLLVTLNGVRMLRWTGEVRGASSAAPIHVQDLPRDPTGII
jgi:Cd2+/Zn2+-exporting ATPase